MEREIDGLINSERVKRVEGFTINPERLVVSEVEPSRMVDYLRFSITDRCNLNCLYCAPVERERILAREEVLRYEEIVMLVRAFVKAGIKKLRLTGGEPLGRKNIVDLINMLKTIAGLEEITITTNGVYLENLIDKLKKAGLDRVNVSLDTLKKERFRFITGLDYFDKVWAGIEKALEIGLAPLKLNVIIMKGINDDEITDFVRLAVARQLIVRFIEFFPANKRFNKLAGYLVKNECVKKKITKQFGPMKKVYQIKGNGPSEYYSIANSKGIIGFISNVSSDFCYECNRIRVDCAGRVSPCLFSGHICDLRPFLRNKNGESGLLKIINDIITIKPGFTKKQIESCCGIEMSSIGG